MTTWTDRSRELSDLLSLSTPPIAITFSDEAPAPLLDDPLAPPAADGRTGRAPAGCVFWMRAAARTFTTVADDHANCSVGSYTHGLVSLEDAAGRGDVGALLESGWVTEEMVPAIPAVSRIFRHITYGPLADSTIDPDVVLLRVNAKQLMALHAAIPGLRIEGKPQCHIVAIAKEHNTSAASVGCALSRVRTGMPATEMTCAIPAGSLGSVLEDLRAVVVADATVAHYAAEDSQRFG